MLIHWIEEYEAIIQFALPSGPQTIIMFLQQSCLYFTGLLSSSVRLRHCPKSYLHRSSRRNCRSSGLSSQRYYTHGSLHFIHITTYVFLFVLHIMSLPSCQSFRVRHSVSPMQSWFGKRTVRRVSINSPPYSKGSVSILHLISRGQYQFSTSYWGVSINTLPHSGLLLTRGTCQGSHWWQRFEPMVTVVWALGDSGLSPVLCGLYHWAILISLS